jgi:glioma pathogenesis-related protein 2
MVKRWLKEEHNYNFGADGNRKSENFTQLVWQNAQEIGVGRARSQDGKWSYGVVMFNPPGNIPSKYTSNVSMRA